MPPTVIKVRLMAPMLRGLGGFGPAPYLLLTSLDCVGILGCAGDLSLLIVTVLYVKTLRIIHCWRRILEPNPDNS